MVAVAEVAVEAAVAVGVAVGAAGGGGGGNAGPALVHAVTSMAGFLRRARGPWFRLRASSSAIRPDRRE